MAPNVFIFLPVPANNGHYREKHPFGPMGGFSFHTDLAIEVDPAVAPTTMALACVEGMLRWASGPTDPTGTMVLIPLAGLTTGGLVEVAGRSVIVFVYRNLTMASARAILEERINSLPQPEGDDSSIDEKLDSFFAGESSAVVSAGETLGSPGPGEQVPDWPFVGFEIAYVPSFRASDFADLKGWIEPGNVQTRRLDPMAFYIGVQSASGLSLEPTHASHVLFTQTTRRILVEIRDEYDFPIDKSILVDDGTTNELYSFWPGVHGTVAFGVANPGEVASTLTLAVTLDQYEFCELPSGDDPVNNPSRQLTSPAHWKMQAIFMDNADDPDNWFVQNNPDLGLSRFTSFNRITPIRDGLTLFATIADRLRGMQSSDSYVLFGNWIAESDMKLVPQEGDSTLQDLLMSATSTHDAKVRALLWGGTLAGPTKTNREINFETREQVNALAPNGYALADFFAGEQGLANDVGSVHQKFMVIGKGATDESLSGSEWGVGFCGGIDFTRNRLDSPFHRRDGPLYHDVHAMVEGMALQDMHKSFATRWNHVLTVQHAPVPQVSTTTAAFEDSPGTTHVQVALTYPCDPKGVAGEPYDFAMQGSTTTAEAIVRAIGRAKKFIYIEDQYLTPYAGIFPHVVLSQDDPSGVVAALRAALEVIDYLIIVIPNHVTAPQARYRRFRCFEALRFVDKSKVHVYYLRNPRRNAFTLSGVFLPEPGVVAGDGDGASGGLFHRDEIYCHSKVWIVDDVWAKIGSANVNRRSLTHDAEIDIAFVDGALEAGARRAIRDFRSELWGEHLNIKGAARSLLQDHVIARRFWTGPQRAGSRIAPYEDRFFDQIPPVLDAWNLFDPDGTCSGTDG